MVTVVVAGYLIVRHSPYFSYLDRAYFMSLQFELRTEFRSGLLFFISGGAGEHLFIQLRDGNIEAELSADQGTYVFTVSVGNEALNLCDGEWHTVQVVFNYNLMLLKLDLKDPFYRSNRAEVNRVFIRATGTPTFGGVKLGSDTEEYIHRNGLGDRVVMCESLLMCVPVVPC